MTTNLAVESVRLTIAVASVMFGPRGVLGDMEWEPIGVSGSAVAAVTGNYWASSIISLEPIISVAP